MCFFKNNTKKTLLSPCKSSFLVGCTSELRLEGMFWCLPGRKSLDCPLVAGRNNCIFLWISSTWHGLGPQNRSSQCPLCYKCCALVFVLNTVWSFSVCSSQDCEKPGISCLTMHCNLSALAKEESRTIDIYMLLNTEILKKVSPGKLYYWGSFKSIWIGFLRTNSACPL